MCGGKGGSGCCMSIAKQERTIRELHHCSLLCCSAAGATAAPMGMAEDEQLPSKVVNAVLRASELPQGDSNPVAGYDFNHGLHLDALLRSLSSTGFQAAHLGQAIDEVNRMVGHTSLPLLLLLCPRTLQSTSVLSVIQFKQVFQISNHQNCDP
jgi:hypothetical protein